MNPGPAPRPPTDRQRLALTPSVSNLPGSVSGLTLQPLNSSSTSLVRSKTEGSFGGGGAYSVIKEGNAKVKEDGGIFKSLVWNDRFLVLREFQLDFLKSQSNTKVSSSIQLRDITNVTRSEQHASSFEIIRLASSGNSVSPARDGPVKSTICKVETDDEIYSWIDAISQRCPSM